MFKTQKAKTVTHYPQKGAAISPCCGKVSESVRKSEKVQINDSICGTLFPQEYLGAIAAA